MGLYSKSVLFPHLPVSPPTDFLTLIWAGLEQRQKETSRAEQVSSGLVSPGRWWRGGVGGVGGDLISHGRVATAGSCPRTAFMGFTPAWGQLVPLTEAAAVNSPPARTGVLLSL